MAFFNPINLEYRISGLVYGEDVSNELLDFCRIVKVNFSMKTPKEVIESVRYGSCIYGIEHYDLGQVKSEVRIGLIRK